MTMASYYGELAEAVGGGESKYIPGIFESLTDEDEARLLLAASPPATAAELAEKTGLGEDKIEDMLDPLFKKGLLFKSRKADGVRYYRVRHLLQMHDSTAVMLDPPRKMLDLWKAFMAEEFDDFSRKLEEVLPAPIIRVIPVNITLTPKTHILAFDDVKNLVDEARSIAVTPCSCRVIDGACGKSLEVCMQFDKAADYALERGTGRELTKTEAVEMLKRCEEEGLVHVGDNRRSVGHVICNCCTDCCLNWPSVRTGLGKFVVPSRFLAVVDEERCVACETCLERCYFDAIAVAESATVDPEKCMGCGLCLVACPEEAIGFDEVRPEDFVPA
ncbi:MAG: 4Fe-4S binding protein [Deltaproteobacteria bacterium]|nr:4Fe-4S binding protein [Deltaproteobacteria bacterium]MBW2285349.1 4Fe-4S binding protein [Deltaproteobacteria bacterium]